MEWVRVCAAPGCREPLVDRRAEARYCSEACKKVARRLRRRLPGTRSGDDPPGLGSGTRASVASLAPMPGILKPTDAFERLRGNAVLSRWKPDPKAKPGDVPDIPDFLRRPLPAEQACAGCGETFQPTTYRQGRCDGCQPLPAWLKAG